ncbi:hydrolase [Marivita hallyeonensis]|uniref:GyrI-like small molecule binding domain-containing protein n=1 Tax=Marivita hallyeonensis TaxID=996342 RepID=A0A1M5S1F3_9RHOB|nr:hydrolase [Marivita hallyeonensis]SHH32284.1 hypothetical protein SAMN05443551_1969 [Marivita hallyeonensis]
MQTNTVPHFDDSENTTGCCPKFNPEGWDGRRLEFRDKLFARATTKAVMHIPVNMGKVFTRVQEKIEANGGWDNDNMLVLSRDLSPWTGEHLFAVSEPLPGEEMVRLSGEFITKVFEGPYREAKDWHVDMQALAKEHGSASDEVYFFYTTCPKCVKAYGKNYVVGIARLS